MNSKHKKKKRDIRIFVALGLVLLCVVGISFMVYIKKHQNAKEPTKNFPESFEYNDLIDNDIANSIR